MLEASGAPVHLRLVGMSGVWMPECAKLVLRGWDLDAVLAARWGPCLQAGSMRWSCDAGLTRQSREDDCTKRCLIIHGDCVIVTAASELCRSFNETAV